MPPNLKDLTPNDARSLDKMRRHYECILADPLLKSKILNVEAQYNRVMQRIYTLTQPLLELNVYSIPGICKPLS